MKQIVIIVDEEYIKKSAKNLHSNLKELDGIVSGYVELMNSISTEVVKDGTTANTLRAYHNRAKHVLEYIISAKNISLDSLTTEEQDIL